MNDHAGWRPAILTHKLAIWAVAVALVFFVFWELSRTVQTALDPYIILFIGAVKQIIVLMMLAFTRKWSWRAVGVMSVMQGVAVLYLGSAFLIWHPEYIAAWNEPLGDLGRAFLIVGLVPLFIGVVGYGWVVTTDGVMRRSRRVSDNDAWGIQARESKTTRDERQDAREDKLDDWAIEVDDRAISVDTRMVLLTQDAIAQEVRMGKIMDREDAQDILDNERTE